MLIQIHQLIQQEADFYIKTELTFETGDIYQYSKYVNRIKLEDNNRNSFLAFLYSGCLANVTTNEYQISDPIITEFYLFGLNSVMVH